MRQKRLLTDDPTDPRSMVRSKMPYQTWLQDITYIWHDLLWGRYPLHSTGQQQNHSLRLMLSYERGYREALKVLRSLGGEQKQEVHLPGEQRVKYQGVPSCVHDDQKVDLPKTQRENCRTHRSQEHIRTTHSKAQDERGSRESPGSRVKRQKYRETLSDRADRA